MENRYCSLWHLAFSDMRGIVSIPPSLIIKRFVRVAIPLLLLGFIAICGGVRHSTIVRFLPRPSGTPRADWNDGPFRPEIAPFFTEGGTVGWRRAIPLLWYYRSDMDDSPAIMFTTHYAPRRFNYHRISKVVFEELVVTNEHGHRFDLMSESDEKSFSLLAKDRASGRVDLGPVEGKQLKIRATGYAITLEGDRSHFSTDRSWTDTRVTRWGLGIHFIP